MIGADEVAAARRRGVAPALLWVYLDSPRGTWRPPLDVHVAVQDRIEHLDLRFVVGLTVMLTAETGSTDRLARLAERCMQEGARRVFSATVHKDGPYWRSSPLTVLEAAWPA